MEYKFYKDKKNDCVYATTIKAFTNRRPWIADKRLMTFNCQVYASKRLSKIKQDWIAIIPRDNVNIIEITYKEFEDYVNKVIESMLKKYRRAYEKELRNI